MTTIMSSIIPTGSPHTNWNVGVYLFGMNGDITYSSVSADDSYGVGKSYGIWSKYASKFIQNHWWLRSPNTEDTDYSWFVMPFGDVYSHYDYNVFDSCGRIQSSDTSVSSYAYYVRSSGNVDYNDCGISYVSYG